MEKSYPFRARAHLLKLLGDELIGNDRLAVFELVKNSYDADATEVTVTLDLLSSVPSIIVADNGAGMTGEIIEKSWLEIGTDFKRGDKRATSPKFGRLPLGEKGVGRLAVHKLGSKFHLITKSKKCPECEIQIDWPSLIDDNHYIENTSVTIKSNNTPKIFINETTGTRIQVTNLYRTNWDRGSIRALKKLLTTLISPFQAVSDFKVILNVPGREKLIEDIFEVDDILELATWIFEFNLDGEGFKWKYNFKPPAKYSFLGSTIKSSEDEGQSGQLEMLPLKEQERAVRRSVKSDKLFMDRTYLDKIGPISGKFYVFFRREETWDLEAFGIAGNSKHLKDYLNEQTGVRIYRDGVRVFNYGEPGDDWLGLNARRINRPSERIATKSIIGAIHINLKDSPGLTPFLLQ